MMCIIIVDYNRSGKKIGRLIWLYFWLGTRTITKIFFFYWGDSFKKKDCPFFLSSRKKSDWQELIQNPYSNINILFYILFQHLNFYFYIFRFCWISFIILLVNLVACLMSTWSHIINCKAFVLFFLSSKLWE